MKEKNYFQGVKKIRSHELGESVDIVTISGRAQDMAAWILTNCTADGWINIDVKKKSTPGSSTHVAYLSPNQK